MLVSSASEVGCRRATQQETPAERSRAAYIKQEVTELPPVTPKEGCPYGPGDLPAKTLGPAEPSGPQIPIEHFVFVVQENRSFDHYFQDFTPAAGTHVDIAPPSYVCINPANKHEPVRPFELLHPCPNDPEHDYESVLLSWRGGKMDGFALASGKEAVSYFTTEVLEYYHALARSFALSDRHFADFLGPTWPNRLYMLSGTSFGHVDNTAPPAGEIKNSLFRQLESKGLTWRIYADNVVFEQGMYPRLHQAYKDNFKRIAQFHEDAKSGKLPAFAWVESSYGGANATDEHPPANVEIGQHFVHGIIDSTMHGGDWKSSALILTYDEHGGFYDHVAPPAACVPDQHQAKHKPGHLPPRFDHLGMRVPLIVVSPWVKRGYVSHQTTSHVSLLRLIQARFELPALTRRDANATPPFDLFDFVSPPRLEVPDLPLPRIEPNRHKQCEDDVARSAGVKNPNIMVTPAPRATQP